MRRIFCQGALVTACAVLWRRRNCHIHHHHHHHITANTHMYKYKYVIILHHEHCANKCSSSAVTAVVLFQMPRTSSLYLWSSHFGTRSTHPLTNTVACSTQTTRVDLRSCCYGCRRFAASVSSASSISSSSSS